MIERDELCMQFFWLQPSTELRSSGARLRSDAQVRISRPQNLEGPPPIEWNKFLKLWEKKNILNFNFIQTYMIVINYFIGFAHLDQVVGLFYLRHDFGCDQF